MLEVYEVCCPSLRGSESAIAYSMLGISLQIVVSISTRHGKKESDCRRMRKISDEPLDQDSFSLLSFLFTRRLSEVHLDCVKIHQTHLV